MAAVSGVTILLVDDEPSIRNLIDAALVGSGYRVVQARNGNEALRVFDERGQDIDLLITDMRMPYMGGAELIAELQTRRRSLKCLCISGYAVDPDLNVPVLSKPFSRMELLSNVRALLAAV